MKLQILFNRTATPLDLGEVGEKFKIEDLMQKIEETMDIFRRNQRLILKGRPLMPHQTLNEAKV